MPYIVHVMKDIAVYNFAIIFESNCSMSCNRYFYVKVNSHFCLLVSSTVASMCPTRVL